MIGMMCHDVFFFPFSWQLASRCFSLTMSRFANGHKSPWSDEPQAPPPKPDRPKERKHNMFFHVFSSKLQDIVEKNPLELTSIIGFMLDLCCFLDFYESFRDSAGAFGIFHLWRPQLSISVPAAVATTGTFTHPKLLTAFAAWKQLPKVPREILVIQDMV